jgi:hypothetical protein
MVGRRFPCGHRTVGVKEKDRTIFEEPNDGLHEKQKYGRRYTSLTFGNGKTAFSWHLLYDTTALEEL